MRRFPHTVTPDDTAVRVGSGDMEVLATPRIIQWCETAAFEVCRGSVDEEHTTVGTLVKVEHIKGTGVGTEVTVHCAEPFNDGRRLVCFVTVKDASGSELAAGEIHRAIVDRERFMSKCERTA